MYSLFCEAKFWTLKNEVQIKNTDLGVLRYYDKKEADECPYLEGKKLYCNQRGTTFFLRNKRPLKLRDRLKELEQYLSNNKIVFFDWRDENVLYLILNTGLIIAIGVNTHNKDVYKIMFDRFLTGKLLSENISDVLFTKTHLVISYNESQLTLINFNKALAKFSPPEKLAKLEPKVQHVDLCGPTGRRLDRKLSCSQSGDFILTWWHSTRNEVYPWTPLVKDEDRANIHIYSLTGVRLELLCFYRTEFDLINVCFSKIKENAVWLIEQKVSIKGDVTVEYSSYEILKKDFKKISVTSIPLQTQICCHSISPDEEKLVLGCIDGSLILFDQPRGITRLVKSAFIPNLVSWHNDGALIIIANERNQFQFFDLALSCIRTQLLSDDVAPSVLLDLACFFKAQPMLLHIKWNKKENAACYVDRFIPNDHLLLLVFESGPLGVLNLVGGGGLSNDVQSSGLSPDTLIRQYLLWNQSDKALNVFLNLNWNTNGSTCLAGLYHIANHVFRHPFTPEREIQLESALGTFYAPIRPLTRFAESEFGNQVHDLTRRFFHLLLRHQLYEKAYCLAIDINNVDLFLDLYQCAKILEDEEMAFACKAKIEELHCVSENSSHSSCSRSSCSCSESIEDEEDAILPPLPQVSVKKSKASRVPPLPDLNRHNKSRDSAFFNCNPTYLQSDQDPSKPLNPQAPSTSFNGYYPAPVNCLPKTADRNYSTTQILTPEFPHSYEIRTSFTSQESGFAAPSPNLMQMLKNSSLVSVAGNVESLYEPSSDPKLPGQNDVPSVHPETPPGTFGALKLKSPQIQFRPSNASSQFKIGPFEYLAPPLPRQSHFRGERPPPVNAINFNTHLPRSFAPRPYLLPPRQFNNLMLQRPLHFVPNAIPKQVLKPVSPSIAKQKVKFSDTVTHIVVPDFSKLSVEDQPLVLQHRSRGSRNAKASVGASESSSNFPQNLGSKKTGGGFGGQQDSAEDEEHNRTIKVIHFGVV